MFKPYGKLALAGLLLVGIGSVSAADDEQPTYRLKGTARPGSMLPETTVAGALPYDKRYDQLTPEQKAIVRSRYEEMAPGDEPPFPIDGLGPLMTAVWKAANMLGSRGLLSMSVDVDADGTARSVSIYKASDDTTTEVMANLLMVLKYKPAVCSGKPCAMAFPLQVKFL